MVALPLRQRSPHSTALLAALLLLMVVGTLTFPTRVAAGQDGWDVDNEPEEHPEPQHKCIHDEMLRQRAERGLPTTSAVAKVVYQDANSSNGGLLDRARGYLSLTGANAQVIDGWQQLRISIFTEDLKDSNNYCTKEGELRPDYTGGRVYCAKDEVLTAEKRDILLNYIIPNAVKLHKERLLVKPVDSIVLSTMGSWRDFHPPQSHYTDGVSGTDFILYVAAGPTSGNTVAWASTVQSDAASGRPLVGVTNMSPKYMQKTNYAVRVFAHELMHALGFSSSYFSRLTDGSGGSGLIAVSGIRGKTHSTNCIASPAALDAARAHYGCSSMQYVELEDQGGSGSASSHWKMRNAKDELMAAASSAGIYTAMTIAVMEDLGFYKGNHDKAETMTWGKNTGCKLFDDQCVINGVSQFPSLFCDSETSSYVCPSDRAGLGHCRIETLTYIPSYYQYFSDPKRGGVSDFMDYCPVTESYSNLHCSDGNADMMPGSVISSRARCFDTVSTSGISVKSYRYWMTAFCVDVRCSTKDETYEIRVKDSSVFVNCPVGAAVSPRDSSSEVFGDGQLRCPPYAEVCFENSEGSFGGDGAAGAVRMAKPAASAVLLVLLLAFLL